MRTRMKRTWWRPPWCWRRERRSSGPTNTPSPTSSLTLLEERPMKDTSATRWGRSASSGQPLSYLVFSWIIYLNCERWHGCNLTVLPLHNKSPDPLFGPAGPWVDARLLAPLGEGHVPRLLLQEGAVEETEDAKLGQRGGLFSNLFVCMVHFVHHQGTCHLIHDSPYIKALLLPFFDLWSNSGDVSVDCWCDWAKWTWLYHPAARSLILVIFDPYLLLKWKNSNFLNHKKSFPLDWLFPVGRWYLMYPPDGTRVRLWYPVNVTAVSKVRLKQFDRSLF